MPIHFAVSSPARLVVYTVEGTVTREEAHQFVDAVLEHFHYGRGYGFLGNACGTDEPDAAFNQIIARAVGARSHLLGPCRWAVVVPPEVGRGMVRMWAGLMRGTGVMVMPFATQNAAADWVASGTGERRPLVARPY